MIFKCVGHFKRSMVTRDNNKVYYCRVFGVCNDPIEKNSVTESCDGFSVLELKIPVSAYDSVLPQKGKFYKVTYTQRGYLDEFEEVQI